MASCWLLRDGLKNFAIMLARELRQIKKKDNVRPHLFRKRYLLVATTQEKKTIIIKNVFWLLLWVNSIIQKITNIY